MKQEVKELLKRKGPLAENEVKDILNAYGINTTKYKLVNKQDDKNVKEIIAKLNTLINDTEDEWSS